MIDDRTAAALERIATALEQMALDRVPNVGFHQIAAQAGALARGEILPSEPPWPTQAPADLPAMSPSAPLTQTVTVPLPPVAAPFQFTGPTASCPVHHLAWRTVPAGVSKKTGKPYGAFLVCPESSCEERPRA